MANVIAKDFVLNRAADLPIKGIMRYTAEAGEKPLVLVLHGFKGFKEYGFFPYICEEIAAAGALTAIIDFSHNGVISQDPVYEADVFAVNTVSQQLKDAANAVDYLTKEYIPADPFLSERWNGDIYLLGHSMGGAISILFTPGEKRIGKICSWAAVSKFERYTRRQKTEWKEKGRLDFTNTSTGQELYLDIDFLNDLERNDEKFNIPNAASQIKIPFLIIHGSEDMTVPLKEGNEIFEATDKNFCNFHIVEKTGHVFGIEHPMKKPTKALENALEKTINFFALK